MFLAFGAIKALAQLLKLCPKAALICKLNGCGCVPVTLKTLDISHVAIALNLLDPFFIPTTAGVADIV